MKQEIIDIEELAQDSHNFNKGNEQGQQLMERSFKELGAGRSILLDRNGNIIAGNKSQKAAIAAGIKKVRVIETTGDELVAVKRTDVDIDSAEGRKMAYLDNLTTQVNLTWDETELQAVQADVEGFDIADFGFDIEDLPQVTFPTAGQGEGKTETQTEVKVDDFDPDAHYETKVKAGEVWQLGEHRLMCGDSTDADAVAKLMNGERADIAFTSPPYNTMAGFNIHDDEVQKSGYFGGENVYNEYSDDRTAEDYAKFLSDVLHNCMSHSDDTFFNIGYTNGALVGTALFLGQNAKNFCGAITWVKNTCFMPFFPIQLGILGNITEPIYMFTENGGRKLHHPQWKQGETSYNIVKTENASGNEYSKEHSATFPVSFAAEILIRFSEKSVLDCFGGTGTTMIAAEQLGRKCYMMELDPHYCDVIIARWEKLTGQKAIKLNQ